MPQRVGIDIFGLIIIESDIKRLIWTNRKVKVSFCSAPFPPPKLVELKLYDKKKYFHSHKKRIVWKYKPSK